MSTFNFCFSDVPLYAKCPTLFFSPQQPKMICMKPQRDPHFSGLEPYMSLSLAFSRTMKVLLPALVLALVLANGSALKCYNCVPGTPGGSCVTTQETCGYKKDTCVSARFISPYSYFRRCISMADCMILQSSPNMKVKCCQTDLCNTPI
ncbi:CD59 glycoprotein-like [Puntigrus tetrazona]|uniref:CD59 glycoprotein-like n=1 Tax=Puntigrus tetrazona TaxID=1606681 RepID=UPI001C89BEB1|nr:CD59 glycoprotein-like [Puntigrus tetrazona]